MAARESKVKYKDELLEQVAKNEQVRVKSKEEMLAESVKIQQQWDVQKKKLEMIKTRKIEELKTSGVPDKYIAELAKKKIGP